MSFCMAAFGAHSWRTEIAAVEDKSSSCSEIKEILANAASCIAESSALPEMSLYHASGPHFVSVSEVAGVI